MKKKKEESHRRRWRGLEEQHHPEDEECCDHQQHDKNSSNNHTTSSSAEIKHYEEQFRLSLEAEQQQQQQQQQQESPTPNQSSSPASSASLSLSLSRRDYHHNGITTGTNANAASTSTRPRPRLPYWLIPALVVLVGLIASSVILVLGHISARRERTVAFDDKSYLFHHQLSVALEEYELIGQWVRQVAHNNNNNNSTTLLTKTTLTREQFRQAYEYVTKQVLQFGSIGVVQMVPRAGNNINNTSAGGQRQTDHDYQRRLLEDDTRTFLRDYIDANVSDRYVGFHQGSFLNPADYRRDDDDDDNNNNTAAAVQEYAVVHWLEPIVVDLTSTYDWLDLDLLAIPETAAAIRTIRRTEQAVLTKCIPCFGNDSVVLLHPGVRMSWEKTATNNNSSTTGGSNRVLDTLSLVEIRLDFLLFRVFQRSGITHHMGAFIFDSTSSTSTTTTNTATTTNDDRSHKNNNNNNNNHHQAADNDNPEYLTGAYHEIIDHATAEAIVVANDGAADPNDSVRDVHNAIVANLSGTDANIWTISSRIDAYQRAAVASFTQPDGSIVINGARYRPSLPPESIATIQQSHDRSRVMTIHVASRTWTVVVTGDNADYPIQLGYVILSAVMLLAGCACLALWIYTSEKRSAHLEEVRLRADAEKTDIVVKSARLAAQNERELNDFIAHEVRNPLSAAMSAATFVAASVHELEPLRTAQAQEDVREDMLVIESSLQFINDLLRNMLDIHRASSQQLSLNLEPMDVLHDALLPVASMLYSRTSLFKVEVVCPDNLTILADKIRIKQVILNLGRNAAKFVQRGFIRFRAALVDGKVVLYVEDSGPGIPKEKRDNLFKKFQESLDTLQQGTGIGLAVCRSIMALMGGSIELDGNYDSQVEGPSCKGARFVINLALEPISSSRLAFITNTLSSDSYKTLPFRGSSSSNGMAHSVGSYRRDSSLSERLDVAGDGNFERDLAERGQETAAGPKSLPHKLNVLFVDDDMILRKLFVRSLQKALPEWRVEQCANGETCTYYDPPFCSTTCS
jgi:signal transduction histidine kinase